MIERVGIKQFSEIEVSDDGTAIIVSAELAEKAVVKWEVPYRHAVWLSRAVLSVAHKAVERQVTKGIIEPSLIPMDLLRVETFEVLVKPKQKHAIIVATGDWKSNSAPGTTALLSDSSTAQVLMDQLRKFVDMVQTVSRPS